MNAQQLPNSSVNEYSSYLLTKGEKAHWLTSMNFAIILISVALLYLLVMAVQSCCKRRASYVDLDDEGYFLVRGEAPGQHHAQSVSYSSEISYLDR